MQKVDLAFRTGSLSPSQMSKLSKFTEFSQFSRNFFTGQSARFKKSDLNEDKLSVAELEAWTKSSKKLNSLAIFDQAKQLLNRRLSHAVEVESAITSRKDSPHRLSTSPRNVSSSKIEAKKIETKKASEKHRIFRLFELEITAVYYEIENKVKNLDFHRESLRKEIGDLRNTLKECLDAFESKKNHLLKFSKQKRPKNVKNQNEVAMMFFRQNSIKDELIKNEIEFQTSSSEISKEIARRSKLIEALDSESSDLKQELSALKFEIVKHYNLLLQEGRDVLHEGIYWIVLKLWEFGQNIHNLPFPDFLDDSSVERILELAKMHQKLNDLFRMISQYSKNTNSLFSQRDKWNSIHTRLALAAKKTRTKKPEYETTIDNKRKLTWINCHPGIESMKESEINELAGIDKSIQETKRDIETIKQVEVARVYREYSISKFNKKKANLEIVLGAIVGYDNIEKHLNLLRKTKKEAKINS